MFLLRRDERGVRRGPTKAQIAAHLGVSQKRVQQRLAELKAQGEVEEQDGGTWWVPEPEAAGS